MEDWGTWGESLHRISQAQHTGRRLDTVQCILLSVYFTLYTVKCIPYTVYCEVYRVKCILYSV